MGWIGSVLFNHKFLGWFASFLLVLCVYFVGDKNIWGLVFGAVGNALWVYVGLKRGKQYDLMFIAGISTVLYLIGLFKWMG